MIRFIKNLQYKSDDRLMTPYLKTEEMLRAEEHLFSTSQEEYFTTEIELIKSGKMLPNKNRLLPLSPRMGQDHLLRVGGRLKNSRMSYQQMHPVILHGRSRVTKLMIESDRERLLHGGPTLITASLLRRFHIMELRKTVKDITRKCVICRRRSARPEYQMMGQLPAERITPGSVFDTPGLDYAGPISIKYAHTRKPVIVK